ncbi:hypothetical protein [Porphyromonas cangingivalis]|uniref:hypothetical protein n=1 Tax=Porphyromonas cangingivalis TaxID=36874 RepID=UPI002432FBD3|nr:hypothetical protein [Porphyromonas cangingivalis]
MKRTITIVMMLGLLGSLWACSKSRDDSQALSKNKYTMEYLDSMLDKGGVFEEAILQDLDFNKRYDEAERIGKDPGPLRGHHIGLKYKTVVFSSRGGCIRVPADGNKDWSIDAIWGNRQGVNYRDEKPEFFGQPVRIVKEVQGNSSLSVMFECDYFRVRKVDNALDIILLDNPSSEAVELTISVRNYPNSEFIKVIQQKRI